MMTPSIEVDEVLSTSILIPLDVPYEDLVSEIEAMHRANKAIDQVMIKITSEEFLNSDLIFDTDAFLDELSQYGFFIDEYVDAVVDNVDHVINKATQIIIPNHLEISKYGG